MSFFSWRRKSLNISEEDPAYKVRYLGNIHTCMMKGEGCVDKPASILWNNYLQSSHQTLDMKIVVSVSGIKAYTKEQGLMQYWSHKISYIIAHPQYPRMFLWVYRHEGRKMKLDLRCHAVLCKSEAKAKLLDVQLHEKLSFALKEFVRDKKRKHNSRLIFEKTNSELTNGSILPLRQQLLSQGGKFKPPVSKMNSAPKLGMIFELDEKEEEKNKEFDSIEEEEEELDGKQVTDNGVCAEVECEEDEEEGLGGMNDSIDDEDDDGNEADDDLCTESDMSDGIESLALDPESDNASVSSDHVCQTDGIIIKQDDMDFLLSKPKKSDSDGESSESGFSDSSKEIGFYRVDDGDRLNEERDGVALGSNTCCHAQCDKDSDCHNDNSFDVDNEDDGFERSSSIHSNSSGDSVSNNNNNNNNNNNSNNNNKNSNNNNKHAINNLSDSSTKQHIHLEDTTTTMTAETLQKLNENNNKITTQSSKNNDNNNTFITESRTTSSSSTSTSELSSSSSSSSKSSIVSPLYHSNSSTSSPSSPLTSPIVSPSTTESAKMVQFL